MNKINLNFCKKILLSISSILLLIFLLIHLIGNLGIFLGKSSFNNYAELIQSNKTVLWLLRLSLIISFSSHVLLAIYLSFKNKLSNPVKYTDVEYYNSSFSSRTMLASGFIVVSFIIFHILHLTIGCIDSNLNILFKEENKNIYEIVINSFKNKYVLVIYLFSLLSIFFHIKHGIFSFHQTLGIFNKKKNVESVSIFLSVIVVFFYIFIPISIALNWIK